MSQILYAGYLEAPSWGVSLRKAQHEPIISLETFEKIQARRNENAYAPTRKDIHRDFPLRGAVCCNSCSSPLTAGWSTGKYKKYPYYFCKKKGCTDYGKTIARAKLEDEFETLLKGLQPTKGLFQIAFAMFKDAWNMQMEKTVLSQSLTGFKKPCSRPNSRRSPGGKIALRAIGFDQCVQCQNIKII